MKLGLRMTGTSVSRDLFSVSLSFKVISFPASRSLTPPRLTTLVLHTNQPTLGLNSSMRLAYSFYQHDEHTSYRSAAIALNDDNDDGTYAAAPRLSSLPLHPSLVSIRPGGETGPNASSVNDFPNLNPRSV
jgi:hypothetical protein